MALRFFTSSVLSAVTACALASTGCNGSASANAEVPAEPSAMIGPEGGTIEGPADGPFAGVRLEIPPGALAATTRVSIAGALDPTAMPALAERVGTQFRVRPESAVLAVPARLTLPVDADAVRGVDQGPGDVKVWVREGDGWVLRQPAATSEGSVTIELPSFTTAAAGVRLVQGSLVCSSTGTIRCLTPVIASEFIAAPCADPSGFCVERPNIPRSPFSVDFAFGADATSAYVFDDDADTIRLRQYNLTTGAVVAANTLTGVFTVRRNSPLAIESDGSLWIGLTSLGNGRYRMPNNASERYDRTDFGTGALRMDNGNIVRITPGGFFTGVNGTFGARVRWPAAFGTASPSSFAPNPMASDTFYALMHAERRIHVVRGAGASAGSTVGAGIAISGSRTPVTGTLTAGGERVAVITSPGRVIAIANATSASTTNVDENLPSIAEVAFDNQGGMWAGAFAAPEVFYIAANGGVSSVLLSAAAEGTQEFNDRATRHLRAQPDGSVVLVTANGTFFRLRRSNR